MAYRKHFIYFSVASALIWAISILWPSSLRAREKEQTASQRLADYLARARAGAEASPASAGSLWSPQGRFTDLATDYKARKVNDLIVIHVIEQTQATSAGTVKTQRAFNASSGISTPFGGLSTQNKLQNLFSPTSTQNLNGQAQANSNTSLNATLSGHVVEVLPNGYLVVQAERNVEMNNERQALVVRGIVRPGDLAQDNSVLSTSISNLEVELKGKGVISDGVRPPNRIVRAILKVVGF